MQNEKGPETMARIRRAHAEMRSALALLDSAAGTGIAAAYLDHAISLVEQELGMAPETAGGDLWPEATLPDPAPGAG